MNGITVDLHILQNFADSNLNRGEDGAPKDSMFGGSRRIRQSSQSWKRAIRRDYNDRHLIDPANLSMRTKHLYKVITDKLVEDGHSTEESLKVAQMALRAVGIVPDGDSTTDTQYLVFAGNDEIDSLTKICHENFDALLAGKKDDKKKTVELTDPKLKKVIANCFKNTGRFVDIALFGRMLADNPGINVDAAAHVAHAISTHRMLMESDYYTAVDDIILQDEDGKDISGAGMLGNMDFASSCVYRYASINLDTLIKNLDGDTDLAKRAVLAFLDSMKTAIPSGKQSNYAAYQKPSFIMVSVRKDGPMSLTNAFVKPVPTDKGDVVANSVKALDDYNEVMLNVYGSEDVEAMLATVAMVEPPKLSERLTKALKPSTADLANALGEVLDKVIADMEVA